MIEHFFFKCHTRFRASAITVESILSTVIFLGKFFTGVVSHCLPPKASDYSRSNIYSELGLNPYQLDQKACSLTTRLAGLPSGIWKIKLKGITKKYLGGEVREILLLRINVKKFELNKKKKKISVISINLLKLARLRNGNVNSVQFFIPRKSNNSLLFIEPFYSKFHFSWVFFILKIL